MLDFDPFSGLTSVGSKSGAEGAGKRIAGTFDTFLTLLTAQLKHQDPTEPLDTSQLTQQLVQFAGVEQDIQQTKSLESLVKLSATNAISGAVGYIGKLITSTGEASKLADGSASWGYSSPAASPSATFTVFDEGGNAVFSDTRSISKGDGTFSWDGRRSDGSFSTDGTYKLKIQAADANGLNLDVTTSFAGIVDGVTFSGSEPVFTVKGRDIKITDILSVKISSES